MNKEDLYRGFLVLLGALGSWIIYGWESIMVYTLGVIMGGLFIDYINKKCVKEVKNE